MYDKGKPYNILDKLDIDLEALDAVSRRGNVSEERARLEEKPVYGEKDRKQATT